MTFDDGAMLVREGDAAAVNCRFWRAADAAPMRLEFRQEFLGH